MAESAAEDEAAMVSAGDSKRDEPILIGVDMGEEKECALLETILFLETNPIGENVLSRVSGLSVERVSAALERLAVKFAAPDSGLELFHLGGGIIISPKKEYWDVLRERYGKKNDSRLSRAAMETLSIIAYSQPITRAEIEALRGVSADNMMRLLIERNLIKEVGKKDVPGKPTQYGTTKEFLEQFRMNSIADLPRLDDAERERFAGDDE